MQVKDFPTTGRADPSAHATPTYYHANQDSIDDFEEMKQGNAQYQTLKDPGGFAPKRLYRHSGSKKKYLVKPYHYLSTAGQVGEGWGETTATSLYKAGSIPHLIQNSHVTMGTDESGNPMPLLVVHMDPRLHSADQMDPNDQFPSDLADIYLSKMQMGAIDYITGNTDRHRTNLMFLIDNHTGRLLHPVGIDNSGFNHFLSASPETLEADAQNFSRYFEPDGYKAAGLKNTPALTQAFAPTFCDWWTEHSPMMRLAFHKQIPFIKDQGERDRVDSQFQKRCSNLDKVVKEFRNTGNWTAF